MTPMMDALTYRGKSRWRYAWLMGRAAFWYTYGYCGFWYSVRSAFVCAGRAMRDKEAT